MSTNHRIFTTKEICNSVSQKQIALRNNSKNSNAWLHMLTGEPTSPLHTPYTPSYQTTCLAGACCLKATKYRLYNCTIAVICCQRLCHGFLPRPPQKRTQNVMSSTCSSDSFCNVSKEIFPLINADLCKPILSQAMIEQKPSPATNMLLAPTGSELLKNRQPFSSLPK